MNNVISALIKSIIPCAFFLVLQQIVYRLAPIPESITKIKDKVKRKNETWFYLSNFISYFHCSVLVGFGGYFWFARSGSISQSSSDEELVIIVSSNFLEWDVDSWIVFSRIFYCGHDSRLCQWISWRFFSHSSCHRNLDWIILSRHVRILFLTQIWNVDFFRGTCSRGMMWGFFIAEVTNPLLTTYDILQKNGYPEKKIGFLAQIFGLSFIYCRIWACPMLNIEW